jgi:NADPH-dependent F420 reductase
MRVGIVGGTGPAGKALAVRLAASGADVLLGSRSAERGEDVASEVRAAWPAHSLALRGVANAEAAASDIVVLATPFEGCLEAVLELAEPLAGRVVVSMINAIARVGKELQALVPARGSVAATLQSVLPRSSVTAAFQHLPAKHLANLDRELRADVFVCADTAEGAEATAALVDSMSGLRAVHCGSLASAGAVEAMTAVLVNVNIRYKSHVAIELTGLRMPGA